MVLEIIIVIIALGMELSTTIKPTLYLSDRNTGISFSLCTVAIGYCIYSIMWAINGDGIIKISGITICFLSVISFAQYLVTGKKNLIYRRIDSLICSIALAAVLLSRFGLIS